MGQCGSLLVAKNRDAVLIHGLREHLLGVLVSMLRMLESSPGKLLSGLVVLLLMGFSSAPMSVGGGIVQLRGPLMVLVMRSVVIASGHLKTLYLPRLIVGFLCEAESVTRVFQRSLRMPYSFGEIPFFIVLGSGAVGLRRKFVLLGRFPVRLVHGVSSR
jgi:hypothetical protein